MINHLLRDGLALIARIGADPNDSDEIRLKKELSVGIALAGIVSLSAWALLLFQYGELLAASLWLAFALELVFVIFVVAATHKFYNWLAVLQVVLVLLVPLVSYLLLGGLVLLGGVLWGFLSPLMALFFLGRRAATFWFFAYVLSIVVGLALQPLFPPSTHMGGNLVLPLFAITLISVSLFTYGALYYFVGQRNLFQEQADNLLLNILPADIAAILKREQRTIADQYDDASILFADVVNFTPLSASLTPAELIELLNEVFSHFDLLVEQRSLEKIKTIGDAYMVAAGVPRPRANHAQALADLALAIQAYAQSHQFRNGRKISFRIGINSGPVVAGVIGRKKFIYDLWGDAVNVASRMESTGASGMIQITRATYERIRDEFACEPRGMLNVKGKGEVEVWNVIGRKANGIK